MLQFRSRRGAPGGAQEHSVITSFTGSSETVHLHSVVECGVHWVVTETWVRPKMDRPKETEKGPFCLIREVRVDH